MNNNNLMEKAQTMGYKGDSNTEASAWVNAVDKGLDLSDEARYARAKEMGFDTDLIYYHGTKRQFDRFDKSTIGDNFTYSEDSGFFFTIKKSTAESYAIDHKTMEVDRVLSVFLKYKDPYVTSTDSEYWNPSDRFDISGHDMMHEVRLEKKDAIFIKGTRNDDICVVLDPSQILSIHAAFDLETENYKPELDMEELLDDFVLENKYDKGEGLDQLDSIISDFCDYCKQENKNRKETELALDECLPDWLGDSLDEFKKIVNKSLNNYYGEEKKPKNSKRKRLRI